MKGPWNLPEKKNTRGLKPSRDVDGGVGKWTHNCGRSKYDVDYMFLKDYIKYTYAVIAGAQLDYGHFIDN